MAGGGAAAAHGERFARQVSKPHWEDFRFFRHNRAHVASAKDCLTSPPAWPGLYRPLSTNCYYYAGRTLFGNRLEVYHGVNAVLFVANGVLLFVIASAVLPGRWPLLATALFVTRRAHAPILVNTSEAQALLSSLFALAALACVIPTGGGRWRRPAMPPLFLAALLCKETVVVVPLIVAAYWRLFEPRETSLRSQAPALAGFLGVTVVWAALLLAARGRAEWTPTGFTYDVSWDVVPRLAAHLLSFVNALSAGPAQVEMPQAVVDAAWSPVAIGATVALLAMCAEALRRTRHALRPEELAGAAFGLAWFVAAALPFLFFADRLFMRYGYFAHAGLAIAGAALAAIAARSLSGALSRANRATARPATP